MRRWAARAPGVAISPRWPVTMRKWRARMSVSLSFMYVRDASARRSSAARSSPKAFMRSPISAITAGSVAVRSIISPRGSLESRSYIPRGLLDMRPSYPCVIFTPRIQLTWLSMTAWKVERHMEHVVLLDPAGVAVGSAAKEEVHTGATPLHLAFSCYVLDGAGRLLV